MKAIFTSCCGFEYILTNFFDNLELNIKKLIRPIDHDNNKYWRLLSKCLESCMFASNYMKFI